jgi:hypothetical protein
MKKLFTIVLIAFFGFFAKAQSGAKIEFRDRDNTIDYGTVSKDRDDGLRTFEFTNTGDADLIITNVQSTSGCVASKPNGPIKPGGKGRIDVKYTMNPGPIRKTITVESNAVNYAGGKIPLKIKGTVN